MTPPEITDHLVMLAEMGHEDQVQESMRRLHPADAAELLDAIEDDDLRSRLFAHLETPRAAAVLSLLGDQARETFLDTLPEARLRGVLTALESDDAADLLAELPREKVERLLQAIPPRLSADVRDLLRYDEETAGGIMQREFVAQPADATVDDAIDTVRRRAADVPDIHNIFVVDDLQQLIGVLPLRLLILANPRTPLRNIMQVSPVAAHTAMDQEEVATLFSKYDLLCRLNQAYGTGAQIEPSDEVRIDRTLDGSRFRVATATAPARWDDMIAGLVADPTPYNDWRRKGV